MAVHLSKQEKETVIVFNESDTSADVFTYNRPLIRRLRQLQEEYPDDVYMHGEDGDKVSFNVPKSWIRINPRRKRPLTDEQRQELISRLKKSRR